MNGFDNFCKRVLKSKRYIRYVDDCVPRRLITTDNTGGLSYSHIA